MDNMSGDDCRESKDILSSIVEMGGCQYGVSRLSLSNSECQHEL